MNLAYSDDHGQRRTCAPHKIGSPWEKNKETTTGGVHSAGVNRTLTSRKGPSASSNSTSQTPREWIFQFDWPKAFKLSLGKERRTSTYRANSDVQFVSVDRGPMTKYGPNTLWCLKWLRKPIV
jgi:hypothetical protein